MSQTQTILGNWYHLEGIMLVLIFIKVYPHSSIHPSIHWLLVRIDLNILTMAADQSERISLLKLPISHQHQKALVPWSCKQWSHLYGFAHLHFTNLSRKRLKAFYSFVWIGLVIIILTLFLRNGWWIFLEKDTEYGGKGLPQTVYVLNGSHRMR